MDLMWLVRGVGYGAPKSAHRNEGLSASSMQLAPVLQTDYFTLRARIATITGQMNYLQGYIMAALHEVKKPQEREIRSSPEGCKCL
ncbi:hypothetical protein EMIT091MI3_100094 [Kosakonia quasisacchari]